MFIAKLGPGDATDRDRIVAVAARASGLPVSKIRDDVIAKVDEAISTGALAEAEDGTITTRGPISHWVFEATFEEEGGNSS